MLSNPIKKRAHSSPYTTAYKRTSWSTKGGDVRSRLGNLLMLLSSRFKPILWNTKVIPSLTFPNYNLWVHLIVWINANLITKQVLWKKGSYQCVREKGKVVGCFLALWLANEDASAFPSLFLIGSSFGYPMIMSKTPLTTKSC